VSAGAKKVKELRKARTSNEKPFDGRFKADHPTIEYSSDYEGHLPDDDYETCCPIAEINPKKKIRTEELLLVSSQQHDDGSLYLERESITSETVPLKSIEEEAISKSFGINCLVVSEAEDIGAKNLLWLKSKFV
jgi:hypothetical protein